MYEVRMKFRDECVLAGKKKIIFLTDNWKEPLVLRFSK